MTNSIEKLIENGDFESIAEFKDELKNNRDAVIEYLQWRVGGGAFKNEQLPSGYAEACQNLLKNL